MGWTKSYRSRDVPAIWEEFFELDKTDQDLWMQGYAGRLAQLWRGHFQHDFQYAPFLAQDLAKLRITTTNTNPEWWRGIVGAHLSRETRDTQALWQLTEHEADHDNLMVTDDGARKRRGKAPPQIQTHEDLVAFVGRLAAFTGEWLPLSSLYSHACKLLEKLTSHAHKPHSWIQQKGGEVVWWLKQIEMAEFGKVTTRNDYATNEYPTFNYVTEQDIPSLVTLLGPNPCYSSFELPESLKPPDHQAPAPAPATQNPGRTKEAQ